MYSQGHKCAFYELFSQQKNGCLGCVQNEAFLLHAKRNKTEDMHVYL